eukprot:657997_1
MIIFPGRILYLSCFYQSLRVGFAECGYYDEIPTDICGYKSVEYISGVSFIYACEYNMRNQSWSIVQSIFNNAECSGAIIDTIQHDCVNATCHCSVTSSGHDCLEYAVVRTEEFDYTHKQCDPTSYTESVVAVNENIFNNGGKYECSDSKLLFIAMNDSDYDMDTPVLVQDDCVSIRCINNNPQSMSMDHMACLPVNECQNQYHIHNGNSSWQYVCNNETDMKSKVFYKNQNCAQQDVNDIFDMGSFEHQHDIVNCNECNTFLKIKEYDVSMEDTTCDETNTNDYNWNEIIFGLGCHSFRYGNGEMRHSLKRSCTNTSYSVRKYSNANCSGTQYGEYTVHEGCYTVDIFMFDKTYSYESFIQIEKCGMTDMSDDSDRLKMTTISRCIISLILYLFLY